MQDLNPEASWAKGVRDLQTYCWQVAEDHGWHEEQDDRLFVEKLCLIHSEVSECLEEYRSGKAFTLTYYGEGGKPEGIGIELADAIVRICDVAEMYQIDLAAALQEKMAYNETRPYRHGEKKA